MPGLRHVKGRGRTKAGFGGASGRMDWKRWSGRWEFNFLLVY